MTKEPLSWITISENWHLVPPLLLQSDWPIQHWLSRVHWFVHIICTYHSFLHFLWTDCTVDDLDYECKLTIMALRKHTPSCSRISHLAMVYLSFCRYTLLYTVLVIDAFNHAMSSYAFVLISLSMWSYFFHANLRELFGKEFSLDSFYRYPGKHDSFILYLTKPWKKYHSIKWVS